METTDLKLVKQKLSKAIIELYIVLAGKLVLKTCQLIGAEERLQQVVFVFFLSVSAAGVNYAACELEHLLLLITPQS